MVVRQYEVYLVNFDPTVGHEIQKTRRCLVISPNEMNRHIRTVIIAPMTTMSHPYPTRVPLTFQRKQIRSVDVLRLHKRLGKITDETARKVKSVISEMLVE